MASSRPIFNYVDTPNTNLICCICYMPFVEPVTIVSCSHTFCQECILKSMESSSLCPIDRLEFSAEQLTTANPIIRSMLDELLVECVNKSLGCPQICQRQLLSIHLKNSCLYGSVPCPNDDCKESVLRKDASQHVCTHGFKICDQCGMEVKSAEIDNHQSACSGGTTTCEFCNADVQYPLRLMHSTVCPQMTVPCTQTSYGCTWFGKRDELGAHLSSCSYNAISGFFAIYDAKMTAIVDENQVLKRRLELMESVLRAYESSMQTIKVALGPWIHNAPNVQVPNNPTFPELPPAMPSSQQASSASDSVSLSNAPFGDDALAPFFPAEESQPLPRYPQSPNTTPSGSSMFFQNWDTTASGPRSSCQNSVAPLNLSSTLEGTLESLRQSIVTLSTSMDSLGRRHDIALTNETLRINEEIMSIKANMHGLRMQIHAILMDRNAQVRRVQGSQDGWLAPGRLSGSPNGLAQPSVSITKL